MICNGCTVDDVIYQLDNTENAEPKMFCKLCRREVIYDEKGQLQHKVIIH